MASNTSGLAHRIAIVGNPGVPDCESYPQQLTRLRELGFNCVQINIAWGTRPGDEALNLEDVLSIEGQIETTRVQQRRTELQQRSAAAKHLGLRTLFHFGAPKTQGLYDAFAKGLEKQQAVDACLLLPSTTETYRSLVTRLAAELPDVDDLLLYTYDQEAWLCSEFGACPRCAGVPLQERLPPFLIALRDAWTASRPGGRLWWEPWELSAGQIFAIISSLPVEDFGLILHSNIAEVQTAHPVDPWFRNTARMAQARGIPVVGEVFMSSASEEVQPLQHAAFPRLVFQQLKAVREVPGATGVKEYFGNRPLLNDPNLGMAASIFARPEASLEEHYRLLTEKYGPAAKALVAAWEAAADGMERYPWDVCWRIRQTGITKIVVFHAWNGFWIHGHLVDSPSWCSTRRSVFMTSEDDHLHPWFFEDIGLRWAEAAKCFGTAVDHYASGRSQCPSELAEDIERWMTDVKKLQVVATAYSLHVQQTLVAHLARQLSGRSIVATAQYDRLATLLEADAINQDSFGTPPDGYIPARQMLEGFNTDHKAWLETNLQMPTDCRW